MQRNNTGQFLKEMNPWNKGVKTVSNGVLEKYVKENGAWNKGKKLPEFSGKNSSSFKHGMSHTRFNTIWKHIKSRCYKINEPSYKVYGGRGIKCLWKSFEEFRDDMYESYLLHVKEFREKDTTIDRIDNNGHYSKLNCRWATKREQGQNRRNVLFAIFNGERKTVREWSEIKGIQYRTVNARINRQKWSIEKSLNTPLMVNQFR